MIIQGIPFDEQNRGMQHRGKLNSGKCGGCSARVPSVYRAFCDYCSNRYAADLMNINDPSPCDAEARVRLDAMARAARPRVTRDSIELSKPHPWECDESAP